MKSLRELLSGGVDWGALWGIGNTTASEVPIALRSLVEASDETSAEEAYDLLDNFIEVQGSVFSAAVPTVAVLMSALLFEAPSPPARLQILRLLWMMANGQTDHEEVARGRPGVAQEVNAELELGFWAFASWLGDPEFQIRRYCLELMSVNATDVRDRVLSSIAEAHDDPLTREWALVVLRRGR